MPRFYGSAHSLHLRFGGPACKLVAHIEPRYLIFGSGSLQPERNEPHN